MAPPGGKKMSTARSSNSASTANGKATGKGKRKASDHSPSPPASTDSPTTGTETGTATAAATTPPKSKKQKFSDTSRYKDSHIEEQHGIVVRKYYPPEMSNERARRYIAGEIERPTETLGNAIAATKQARDKVQVKDAVVHWFKCDLRTRDNRGLFLAAETAKTKKVPLIGLYIVSPQDFEAHLTAPVRVDFVLRTLEVLKQDLAALDIPLHVETVERRKAIPDKVIDLSEKWGASHIFCNIEYEVDELRREAAMVTTCMDKGISFNAVHDTCVVKPGELSSGTGNQYAVYSPWFRAWCAFLNGNPHDIDEVPQPGRNPQQTRGKFRDLFDCNIPAAPTNKQLSTEEKKKFKSMWPAGEQEALERLQKFLKQKIGQYKEKRNLTSESGTSVISVHLAAGTLAARTCIRAARDANSTKKLDGGNSSIMTWISEVAWRDFYKHVMANWPSVCMNKPFKPEYTNIEWEYNADQFTAWTEGKTGFPIVDAAMRQMNSTGWMHNRSRMIVASFLAKDLLIDWRMGERYFMEHLIDGDFASNNGGWGFSASTGVDPQPYFRIFNPLLQSEKFDSSGDYIRHWVPELKSIQDSKSVHDPYGRGAGKVAEKYGYPKPMVDHKSCRERALARYKAGLGRNTA